MKMLPDDKRQVPSSAPIYYVARDDLKERPAGLTNPVRVHTVYHLSGYAEPSAEDAAALRALMYAPPPRVVREGRDFDVKFGEGEPGNMGKL